MKKIIIGIILIIGVLFFINLKFNFINIKIPFLNNSKEVVITKEELGKNKDLSKIITDIKEKARKEDKTYMQEMDGSISIVDKKEADKFFKNLHKDPEKFDQWRKANDGLIIETDELNKYFPMASGN